MVSKIKKGGIDSLDEEKREELYFQFLVGLKEQVIAKNDDISKLPEVLTFLHVSGPKLAMASQEKALDDIAEIMQISVRIGRLEIAGLIAVVGSPIIQQKKAFSPHYANQVFNLFMNCLNIAKPILDKYIENPDLNSDELRRQEPERHFAWDVLDDIWRAMLSLLLHSDSTKEILKTQQQFHDFLNPYIEYHEGCKQVYNALHS